MLKANVPRHLVKCSLVLDRKDQRVLDLDGDLPLTMNLALSIGGLVGVRSPSSVGVPKDKNVGCCCCSKAIEFIHIHQCHPGAGQYRWFSVWVEISAEWSHYHYRQTNIYSTTAITAISTHPHSIHFSRQLVTANYHLSRKRHPPIIWRQWPPTSMITSLWRNNNRRNGQTLIKQH